MYVHFPLGCTWFSLGDFKDFVPWLQTGIVVTNDGNAILRELDLAHPAAKVK